MNRKGERCDDETLHAEEQKKFKGSNWNESVEHKKDARWLKDLQSEIEVRR